ncbi:MAG: bacillithiol biosynthesis deacetylase BshB1 [Candidatus Aminicenantes bacterium]|nr:bacillithiol biosynthesis deacetylase BshB1 [Candidatus Aminicenantes bacterium]
MSLDALAFGAHADDVEMVCGGTLIKLAAMGYRTGVVALTRGETGTRGSAEIRAREFDAAAEVMGLAVHKMLDIPDGRIEVTWENKLKVIAEIRAHRPRLVFAPYWTDRHPDHENASQLVRAAAYLAGLQKIETGREAFRPVKVIFCQGRFEFAPSFVVDISEVHDRKLAAIRAYASQFHGPDEPVPEPGPGETLIGRPGFLGRIEARDRRFGAQIGVEFGEPFLVREALRVDDPAAFFGPEYRWTIP